MPLYDDKFYFETLKFDDVFKSDDEFFEKVVSINNINSEADIKELYNILTMKYVGASTRYTDEFSFIMALKRELYVSYPLYLKQKELLNDMMTLEISEIMKASNQLRNLVEHPTDPTPNASSQPIDDLSTMQENIVVTQNKLDAIKQKYSSLSRNYLNGIFKSCDQLFTVILGDTIHWVY